MDNPTAAIYCRLSNEDENTTSESESIQNQKLLLTDYARKEHWNIYHVYADENFSGLDNTRPDFLQMLKDAELKKFSIILCKTQSRLTRNLETSEHLLHTLFPLWGIRFVTVVDAVDTASKTNKKARQINSLINEWYCEEISDNIKAVFRRKMEAGQFLGNYAPYGYQKDPKDHHRLMIDPEAAPVVALIYQLYLHGHSCQSIAKHLTDSQLPTPWQKKLSRGEDTGRKNVKHPTQWSASSIGKMLKNQVYLGHLVQGREGKASYKYAKVVPKPPHEWIIATNTHDPIIDEQTFLQVQNKMKRQRKFDKKSPL